jgi:hypothetical protein
MTDKILDAGNAAADALRDIGRYFAKDCNLTFMMTDPTNPDCYMVITNENPDVLIAAINASRTPARTETSL